MMNELGYRWVSGGFAAICLGLLLGGTAFGMGLSGVVTTPEGNPIGDADVWVTQDHEVQHQKTGASGKFAVKDLQVGPAELVAWKDGWSLGGHFGPLSADADIKVVLQRTGQIRLRIVSNTFFPVPGASVKTMLINDQLLVSPPDLAPAGFAPIRASDQGLLVIPNLPQGGFIKLVVGHPDYADSTVAYLPVREEQQEIVLVPGIKLRGRVAHKGRGVAGARVAVRQVGAGSARETSDLVSDAEGYFSVKLTAGVYQVMASHRDYATQGPLSVTMVEGQEPTVELPLETPRYLRGTVLGPDNHGLAGVQVVFRAGEMVSATALSQADGGFVLKVAGSEGTLTVLPPPGLMTAALPNVPVKLGEEQDVKIEAIALKRLPEVSGTVLDDEGQPVAGALVSSHDFETPLLALTNEAGAFQLTLGTMPDKKKVLLRVEHPLRFLDKKLEVDLDRTKPLKVTLAPFQPDLAERPLLPADKELADLRQAPAPPLEGADWFNGAPLTLEALRGKVVVLHFWAGFDDSAPGAGRLQEVQALHAALRTVDDAVFIGVHDASSTAAEVTTFVQRFNVQFPVMRDADPYKTFTSYGIVYLPQTVLIDKKGELRYFQVEGRLLELIKALRREG